MKVTLRYALVGVLLYALFLVLTVPAARVYPALQDSLQGVALYDLDGTLWRGRAAVVQSGRFRFDDVRWSVSTAALPGGRLEADLRFKFGGDSQRATVGRTLGGILYARDTVLRIPAAALESLIDFPGARLGGRLDVDLKGFEMRAGRPRSARGVLRWRNAALRAPVAVELGGFKADISTEGENIRALIADTGGPLQAEGLLTLSTAGEYRFTGYFRVRDAKQTALVQGLQFLGEKEADGRIKVALSGKLPAL
ncbi:MAG TPA: type II secretion system protein N [Gammaproteobacteria bacterium]|nr:type II secretion system protein N [Gammaproteobacteria bacterium]